MSEWESFRIKDFGKVVTGKTPPTADKKFYDKGYKFVTPTDLDFNSYYIRHTQREVSEKARNRYPNYFLPPDSVSYTCIGATIGKSCLNREYVLTNQQINSIIPNKSSNARFIYYYLNAITPSIIAVAGGAATPIVNKSSFENIKINVPPLKTQQKIAKILSNYDDLIENNLKRIKLLEESARLTYEEWFLRFRIEGKKLDINPESSLPFGWQDVLLTDYIDLLRGVEPGSSKYEEVKTDSNIPFIRVGNLSKRDSNIYVSKDLANNKIIDKDDILLSLDGSPGKVRFGLSGCYSTGIRKAVSKQKNVSSIFIYNLLNSPYIQGLIEAYATGATILHAGSSVKKMRLVLPTDEVLDKYNNIEMKKFQLILNLSDEIKLLKEARDILLPRLMTGMIDTDDMDIAV
jgi:type I restriction enzyme S subunit